MVNSTLTVIRQYTDIYNSRNLYGQFDISDWKMLNLAIYNSRNLYGQFDPVTERRAILSTTVEIYMVNSTLDFIRFIIKSTTVEIYMVNSTKKKQQKQKIYNSRNLYGQFDPDRFGDTEQSTTVEIYMVNSTAFQYQSQSLSTTVEIYMVNSTSQGSYFTCTSTTVEIYMVNSTCKNK